MVYPPPREDTPVNRRQTRVKFQVSVVRQHFLLSPQHSVLIFPDTRLRDRSPAPKRDAAKARHLKSENLTIRILEPAK
jgi:hypothetical protein